MALGPFLAFWPIIGLLVAQSSSETPSTILPQPTAMNVTQCEQICSSTSGCINILFNSTTNECQLSCAGGSCQRKAEEELLSTGTPVNISTVAVNESVSKSGGAAFSSTAAPKSEPPPEKGVPVNTSHVTVPLLSTEKKPGATGTVTTELLRTGTTKPPLITTVTMNSSMTTAANITTKPPTVTSTTVTAKPSDTTSLTTTPIPAKSLKTPTTTIKEPTKRLGATTVNKVPSPSSPTTPSTQATSRVPAHPATSPPKSSPGKDVREPNKAILDITASSLTRQVVDTSTLLAILIFGLLFFVVSVILFLTQAYESYKKKDYTQVDYLINGMYSDSGV
uniref:Uncharacterized protein n=1 Tax=Paramormyrops kingsleyae TaxID=1676925 RepID=A0A3B3RHT2_9TELE|nr:uncharacterized protein C11orf24 homolog [Paramormyrops kingsleyae]XP_023697845.1 uncharacterized protein C11orf24 homolog [Paramormyrops kingsleyae]XP_023697846.1 uncharacterized protein C11orf24 homolog [Paramormyrops kingsleyae]XP_023697847.1 uncharacterized protein C11orf24 homolog [Paramormyrops kingsleyae]XP_023697848.1 uncharacterized protein C11orf24 homolog [Paramormyrops kingsleyae]